MNDKKNDLLSTRKVSRTASAPMTYPVSGRSVDALRKNNYPLNKMETRRVTRTDKTDATDPDKKKSSKLEIFYDRVLGEGSFAKVYVARYKGKLVAVKIVDISNAKERHIRQFKRELDIIRILRKHPHPNIPEYYKIIESSSRIIIVMEWCRGGELGSLVKSRLDLTQVKYYFNQILSGYLHLLSLNIIHRDMKAQNIMLTHDLNSIKIIDFGLSKVINTDMTRTVVGSPAYMAPERLGAQDYDSTSDIWSLGIVLYEMIYHINPFHSCKNKATLIKSANIPIDLPPDRDCNEICDLIGKTEDSICDRSKTVVRKTEPVPQHMLEIMSGMLNIDPGKRFDWIELSRYNVIAMSLDPEEDERLLSVLEFYRDIRKEAVARSKNNRDSSSGLNSSDSNDNSVDDNGMFNMEIDGMEARVQRSNSVIDSDICIDGLERSRTIRTRAESSQAIPIPRRNRHYDADNYMAESLGNIAGASVEDRELECLEDYFLTNDPGIFSLYQEVESSPPRRVKATESGFVDVSFLDSVPFLQDDYREPKPYDILKNGSEFGSILYSKSAPVVTGMSRLAKKAGSTLTNIISPPQ
jgi:serine/threonine protein kinase